MSSRQNVEASLDVVTGILTVQTHDVYALIGPSSTLSYVTPYVAMKFGIELEQLHEPFFVSTLVGESIVAARVYISCVVTMRGRDTVADLIELGMVDFDVIMGMDWLYSCFAKLDCRTRTVRFEFLSETVVEWKGDNVVSKGAIMANNELGNIAIGDVDVDDDAMDEVPLEPQANRRGRPPQDNVHVPPPPPP
ncbi:uncharacterized protein [Nicotiana tomentosiformis]|uniref:uncharacterized protein n=1 Tax=Nicotiana tomentosiformis TaxID=4098 RepID=UPI00388CB584